jgi:chlorite dismutase
MMFTTFRGGNSGAWQVSSLSPVTGETLPPVPSLSVTHATAISLPLLPSPTSWRLAGVASHVRYVERSEKTALVAVQAGLGRPEATMAALIPIRKSAAWWDLTQEERRRIFEDKSRHIADSLKYLPAIARQLYHCRDLGEPFDFLTWFEFAPEHAQAFEELVATLRSTEEWNYVEREVDVRLERQRV